MTMECTIRPARPNEIERIAQIEALCFPAAETASYAEFSERYRVFSENFLVAECSGQMIGFINGGTNDVPDLPDEFYHNTALHKPDGAYQTVFGLDVLPDFRGQGIAQKLMEGFIQLARDRHKAGVILTCKERLIPFYEKLGFSNHGVSASCHGGATWYDMHCIF